MKSSCLMALLVLLCASSKGQTKIQVENQAALARLYGYVRYFYPGDEAASIDWNRFLIYGSKKVESCKTTAELIDSLNVLFYPIAPAVRLGKKGEPLVFNKAALIPGNPENYLPISWQHLGVGLANDPRSPYQSARVNRPRTYRKSKIGPVAKAIEVKKYRGLEFKFSGKIRRVKGNGTGHLYAGVYNTDRSTGFFDNMDNRPVRSGEWKEVEITGRIGSEAAAINIGVYLKDNGELHVDDFKLAVKKSGNWTTIYANSFNPEKGEATESLITEDTQRHPDYSFTIRKGDLPGEKYLVIKSKSVPDAGGGTPLFNTQAEFGEYSAKDIGAGIRAIIPLVLYGSSTQTYPAAKPKKLLALTEQLEKIPLHDLTGGNLYLRLAGIAVTWNIFQHFYPYFDVVDTDWKKELPKALADAYADKSPGDFQKTLQELTAKLKDGHISVFHSGSVTSSFLPPIAWEWIEEKLVITHVLDTSLSLKPGDVVNRVNGESPEDYFTENVYPYISAATNGWLQVRASVASLYGEEGSRLKLEITRPDNTYGSSKLRRTLSSQAYSHAFPAKDTIAYLGNGIMYVNLCTADMEGIKQAMPELEKSKSIICDLRGGGPNDNTEFIEHLLIMKDTSARWMQIPRIIYPDQERIAGYKLDSWNLQPREPHLDADIIFLIDGSVISAGESYMSFIEHYQLATIVGQPTAGTNGDVNRFSLPGGYRISWTGRKVLKHDGSTLHGVGIKPHVYVSKTIQGLRENRDEFLEKALEIAVGSE